MGLSKNSYSSPFDRKWYLERQFIPQVVERWSLGDLNNKRIHLVDFLVCFQLNAEFWAQAKIVSLDDLVNLLPNNAARSSRNTIV
jgi:hypothetical protein